MKLILALPFTALALAPAAAFTTLPQPSRINAAVSKPTVASKGLLFSAPPPDAFNQMENNENADFGQIPLVSEDNEEKKRFQLSIPTALNVDANIASVASVVVGTIVTYMLKNYVPMGAVASSCVTGILATMILPEKLALAAFCGSLSKVGMTNLAVNPTILSSSAMGLVAATLFTVTDKNKWFAGVGGRLGLIAQCSCVLHYLLSAIVAPDAPFRLFAAMPTMQAMAAELPTVFSFTILGALFSRYWKDTLAEVQKSLIDADKYSFSFSGQLLMRFCLRVSRKMSNSVGTVVATALLASFLLPAPFATPMFCGAFVAMSAPSKLPTANALVPACLLASIAQQCMSGVMLGGWGGKMGTAALMGVFATASLFGYDYKQDDEDSSTLTQEVNQGDLNVDNAFPEDTMLQINGATTTPVNNDMLEMSALMAVGGELTRPNNAAPKANGISVATRTPETTVASAPSVGKSTDKPPFSAIPSNAAPKANGVSATTKTPEPTVAPAPSNSKTTDKPPFSAVPTNAAPMANGVSVTTKTPGPTVVAATPSSSKKTSVAPYYVAPSKRFHK